VERVSLYGDHIVCAARALPRFWVLPARSPPGPAQSLGYGQSADAKGIPV
jgi:hypothetical protein